MIMKKTILLLLALSGLWLPPMAQAQSTNNTLLVVVNSRNVSTAVSARDIADLYLGRTRNLPNGQSIVAVDHPGASAVRARFYRALTGKAITDINAYWARLLFTGQSSPPQPLADSAAVIEAIKSNPGLIGYVEQAQLPNPEALGLKVILSINAP